MSIDPCRCCLIVKLVFSTIGFLSGISIFIVFLFMYNNYNAAIWGFVSGLFAVSVFHLNYLYMKNKIDEWYDQESLENLKLLGLLVLLSSTLAFGIYLSLAITRHQSYEMNDFNYYPAATFSFLSFKWGFLLFWTARKYKRYVILCNPEFIYSRRHPESEQEIFN